MEMFSGGRLGSGFSVSSRNIKKFLIGLLGGELTHFEDRFLTIEVGFRDENDRDRAAGILSDVGVETTKGKDSRVLLLRRSHFICFCHAMSSGNPLRWFEQQLVISDQDEAQEATFEQSSKVVDEEPCNEIALTKPRLVLNASASRDAYDSPEYRMRVFYALLDSGDAEKKRLCDWRVGAADYFHDLNFGVFRKLVYRIKGAGYHGRLGCDLSDPGLWLPPEAPFACMRQGFLRIKGGAGKFAFSSGSIDLMESLSKKVGKPADTSFLRAHTSVDGRYYLLGPHYLQSLYLHFCQNFKYYERLLFERQVSVIAANYQASSQEALKAPCGAERMRAGASSVAERSTPGAAPVVLGLPPQPLIASDGNVEGVARTAQVDCDEVVGPCQEEVVLEGSGEIPLSDEDIRELEDALFKVVDIVSAKDLIEVLTQGKNVALFQNHLWRLSVNISAEVAYIRSLRGQLTRSMLTSKFGDLHQEIAKLIVIYDWVHLPSLQLAKPVLNATESELRVLLGLMVSVCHNLPSKPSVSDLLLALAKDPLGCYLESHARQDDWGRLIDYCWHLSQQDQSDCQNVDSKELERFIVVLRPCMPGVTQVRIDSWLEFKCKIYKILSSIPVIASLFKSIFHPSFHRFSPYGRKEDAGGKRYHIAHNRVSEAILDALSIHGLQEDNFSAFSCSYRQDRSLIRGYDAFVLNAKSYRKTWICVWVLLAFVFGAASIFGRMDWLLCGFPILLIAAVKLMRGVVDALLIIVGLDTVIDFVLYSSAHAFFAVVSVVDRVLMGGIIYSVLRLIFSLVKGTVFCIRDAFCITLFSLYEFGLQSSLVMLCDSIQENLTRKNCLMLLKQRSCEWLGQTKIAAAVRELQLGDDSHQPRPITIMLCIPILSLMAHIYIWVRVRNYLRFSRFADKGCHDYNRVLDSSCNAALLDLARKLDDDVKSCKLLDEGTDSNRIPSLPDGAMLEQESAIAADVGGSGGQRVNPGLPFEKAEADNEPEYLHLGAFLQESPPLLAVTPVRIQSLDNGREQAARDHQPEGSCMEVRGFPELSLGEKLGGSFNSVAISSVSSGRGLTQCLQPSRSLDVSRGTRIDASEIPLAIDQRRWLICASMVVIIGSDFELLLKRSQTIFTTNLSYSRMEWLLGFYVKILGALKLHEGKISSACLERVDLTFSDAISQLYQVLRAVSKVKGNDNPIGLVKMFPMLFPVFTMSPPEEDIGGAVDAFLTGCGYKHVWLQVRDDVVHTMQEWFFDLGGIMSALVLSVFLQDILGLESVTSALEAIPDQLEGAFRDLGMGAAYAHLNETAVAQWVTGVLWSKVETFRDAIAIGGGSLRIMMRTEGDIADPEKNVLAAAVVAEAALKQLEGGSKRPVDVICVQEDLDEGEQLIRSIASLVNFVSYSLLQLLCISRSNVITGGSKPLDFWVQEAPKGISLRPVKRGGLEAASGGLVPVFSGDTQAVAMMPAPSTMGADDCSKDYSGMTEHTRVDGINGSQLGFSDTALDNKGQGQLKETAKAMSMKTPGTLAQPSVSTDIPNGYSVGS